ncbi:MAG: ABC transporter substrate-binding protein [Paraglaciecola sp.]|uniref:substrate-binding periplasmic protein n=1 Tax=Paraglaciecola sp. TaxID=1920173 RepID=UPI00273F57DB|nr:ABC transporter substrate-binding protein [Paraglaciecola sp.]MDP5032466.1 ABC transporter substrate-binding protein [Paraglaciecola sp.]MDP5130628.1 ABC transporter substrate-binding protein [Paraglaciecola sp.]
MSDVYSATNKHLVISVNSPGSMPYLYFDAKNQKYAGLVVDFFVQLHEQGLFDTEYIDSNQMRSEQFLLSGKADIYLANKAWLAQADKFIFSEPIIQHATYLYSLSPFDESFSTTNLNNKLICTHQNFIYSGLTDSFAEKKIKRVDASDQQTMATMFKNGRCDYMAMNNYNAAEIFSKQTYCDIKVYQSPQPTSMVNLYFVMRPEFTEVKSVIDQYLHVFKNSGKAEKSLASHATSPNFPLETPCLTLVNPHP